MFECGWQLGSRTLPAPDGALWVQQLKYGNTLDGASVDSVSV
jgi:hypothetical protein